MNRYGPTIAVVDDDPAMLESLADLLEAAGYKSLAFSSGQALLDVGLEGLDLIVADIGMPVMDGFELRDIARQQRPGLPVFLITGRHELAERSRSRSIGTVFQKPFSTPGLLAAIGRALRPQNTGGDHDLA